MIRFDRGGPFGRVQRLREGEDSVTEQQLTIGRYELINCIASGNTTQIWEVSETGSPMQMAMKLLFEEALKDPAEKNTLRHEFKVGKSLEHPGFVRFHELEVNRDHGFFIMDFVRAPSLKMAIAAGLPAVQAGFQKLAEDLCRAFQFMHDQGWLHRDIKPDNILVNKAGESKIIDFSLSCRVRSGLGKVFGGKEKTIRGTRNYIAPETILKKPAEPRTDQYSLGVTFFEILTGGLPFAGASPSDLLKKHLAEAPVAPSAINPNVTTELDEIILKMLAKKPADRFADMQEVGTALRGLKCFLEDPVELHEKMLQEEKEKQALSVDKRLDSRADAERTAKGIKAPAPSPRKKAAMTAALKRELEKERQKKAASEAAPTQPPPAAPMPGSPVPGTVPGQPVPGYPMPGMMPGQPIPGQPVPGYPMPGMVPGQPVPGYPMPGMMPGQPLPGQPMPGYPAAGQPMPGYPVPGTPVPGQVAPPIPAAPVPGAAGPVVPGTPAVGPGGTPAAAPVPAAGVPPVPGTTPPDQVPPPAPQIRPGGPHPSAEKEAAAQDASEDDLQNLMDLIE